MRMANKNDLPLYAIPDGPPHPASGGVDPRPAPASGEVYPRRAMTAGINPAARDAKPAGINPAARDAKPAGINPAARGVHVAVAALAMVATLPGRTHGLGVFTEPI